MSHFVQPTAEMLLSEGRPAQHEDDGHSELRKETEAVAVDEGAVAVDKGTVGVDEGTEGVDKGTVTVDEGAVGVDEGAEGVTEGAEGVTEGAEGVYEGIVTVDEGAVTVDEGDVAVDEGTVGVNEGTVGVDERAVTVDEGAVGVDERALDVDEGAVTVDEGAVGVNNDKEHGDDGVGDGEVDDGDIAYGDEFVAFEDGIGGVGIFASADGFDSVNGGSIVDASGAAFVDTKGVTGITFSDGGDEFGVDDISDDQESTVLSPLLQHSSEIRAEPTLVHDTMETTHLLYLRPCDETAETAEETAGPVASTSFQRDSDKESTSCSDEYSAQEDEQEYEETLSAADLLCFGWQIARGMVCTMSAVLRPYAKRRVLIFIVHKHE